ncbi:MAG: 3-oxoacyl-[acyl-carrier-protein] synthase [Solirubrobacteraceae bacterium]|jgi:3-oxoacyl-[acyl-carrier-protein] synthase-3|nr:3-oxoacyl-[acyl-carrier-protein] synthase [Solirubrobacteraceae bacterium]
MAATVETTTTTTGRASTAPRPTPHHRPRRVVRAGLFGIGAALPEHVVTNADIEQRLDTTDEWIVRRTGIRERRHLREDESLADLAARACLIALEDAGRTGADVDHLIVSTITPDRLTPGLAPEVARLIGATTASATDLNAACAGFLYALDQAAALVESGRASVVVVCGAEALSRIVDHDDRGTAVLFGDGAGAAVVCGGDDLDLGIGRFELGADATKADMLYAERDERVLRMEGREVYRHAVRRMVEATSTALARAGLAVADIDLFVAHQANVRIIEAAAAELGVPLDRVAINVETTANTSSASIPLALAKAEVDGLLAPGATVAMAAFGAGFVWGAGIVGWKERRYCCA